MTKKSKIILSRLAKGVKIILSRPDKKKVNITLPRPDKKKVNITLPRPDKKKVNITLPRPDKRRVVAKKAVKSVSQVRGSRILVSKKHVSEFKENSTEKNILFGKSSHASKTVKKFHQEIKTAPESNVTWPPAGSFWPFGRKKKRLK